MQRSINKLEIRLLKIEDYPLLKESMMAAYADMENAYWKEKHIQLLLKKFPDGQFVAVADGIVVGWKDRRTRGTKNN